MINGGTKILLQKGQSSDTYLFLLLVKIVNDDANEEVECEEGAKDDEDDKVYVHVEVDLIGGLLFNLRGIKNKMIMSCYCVRLTNT